eukprot:TRINITY_DN643_c0_g1_i1.p1 TRINITY_DN643_c0_g1~~TRINITY_DN643_c0_g1_i1.p1  ORF type:complete len:652 (-),score=119.59 TRINITY_DN643_c0_g1_i1:302-2257(-)
MSKFSVGPVVQLVQTPQKRRALLRKELAPIQAACDTPGSLVADLNLDGYELNFTLRHQQREIVTTLVIPSSFPRGDYKVVDHHGMREIGPGSLQHHMATLINGFAAECDVDTIPLLDMDSTDDLAALGSVDEETARLFESPHAKNITVAIDAFTKKFGAQKCGLFVSMSNFEHTLRFLIDTDFLSHDLAHCFGVVHGLPIVYEMLVSISVPNQRPKVTIFQAPSPDLNAASITNTQPFRLSWQLQQRLKEHLKWPAVDLTQCLISLYELMCLKVQQASSFCVICDEKLACQASKPCVCDKPLCTFSFMQYGLGEDVGEYVQSHPEVTDLLIVLTNAAAHGDVKRFNPFPAGVETRVVTTPADTQSKLCETVYNFLDEHNQPSPAKVVEVLRLMPKVDWMLQYKTTERLRDALTVIHPLCFPLLRWIITSNRTHLELLQPDQEFQHFKGCRQFVMRGTTPEKEAKHARGVKKHGSFFAFHGSAFWNWHSILRNGLKNYSNTEFMVDGATEGEGIYLGLDSGTSLGYAWAGTAWDKSQTPTCNICLAVCEVVAAGHVPRPWYVVPDENHVNTRFFVLCGSQIAVGPVPAETLRLDLIKRGLMVGSKKVYAPSQAQYGMPPATDLETDDTVPVVQPFFVPVVEDAPKRRGCTIS